jgi:hypothetical protein
MCQNFMLSIWLLYWFMNVTMINFNLICLFIVLIYAKFLFIYLCILTCSTYYGILARLDLWNVKLNWKWKLSNFPHESFHMKSVHCLFTSWKSVLNFCHHQVMFIITVCSPKQSDIKYSSMPPSTCVLIFLSQLSWANLPCTDSYKPCTNIHIWE